MSTFADFDWLDLMRGITELHVESLQSSANMLDVKQVTALSNDPGPLAASREIDQSLEARKLICGLSQGDTALMRDVDSQEVASPQVSDVADVSPVPASAGGEVLVPHPSSPLQHSGDTIERLMKSVDWVLDNSSSEAEREGLMTEMSGYRDPAEDVRFA